MDPTRDWLRLLAERQQRRHELNCAQWLLDNGREFQLGPLPNGVHRMALRGCYLNSLELAIDNERRYVYCEGMAAIAGGGLPGNTHGVTTAKRA
jgi:hypothetical protein